MDRINQPGCIDIGIYAATAAVGKAKLDFSSNGKLVINPDDPDDKRLALRTQYLKLFINGIQVDEKQFAIKYPQDTHPYSADIWHCYKEAHRGNFVIRNGFGYCGCYRNFQPLKPGELPDLRRPESDTEHANGCIELVHAFQDFYPDLLTSGLYYRAERLLKDHDLGENDYGDRLDDGSQNHEEKNQAELMSFAISKAHLPPHARETAILDFVCFQDSALDFPEDYPKDRIQLAQFAKVIDKAETILSAICYERAQAPGLLSYKELNFGEISDQDHNFINETDGDQSIVGGWSAHFIKQYHNFYGFSYALDIIKAAVLDTREVWFDWIDEFCNRHKIPKEHLCHPLL